MFDKQLKFGFFYKNLIRETESNQKTMSDNRMVILEEVINLSMAFICPPVVVYWERFRISPFSFWFNVALTLFFCVPGIIHAFYVMFIVEDISPDATKENCKDKVKAQTPTKRFRNKSFSSNEKNSKTFEKYTITLDKQENVVKIEESIPKKDETTIKKDL